MTGVARFDCYPSDLLNGLIGMTADQIAVYTVVLLLQYDRGEPVLVEGRERELAIRAGLTRKRLEKAAADLVQLGKLKAGQGRVWNGRAEQELAKIRERIEKNRENSEKGGNSTREKHKGKASEINSDMGPTGRPTGGPSLGPNSPPPLPPEEYVESARARDPALQFRLDLVDAYRSAGVAGVPDGGYVNIWLARGHDPKICLAVVAEGLKRKGRFLPPNYFDQQIADAHAAPAPRPQSAAGSARPPPTGGQRKDGWAELFRKSHGIGEFANGHADENGPPRPTDAFAVVAGGRR
jgi:uncharacterized protein YdaU (DUF1376 family)